MRGGDDAECRRHAGRLSRITRPGSHIGFQYNARNWLTTIKNLNSSGTTRYRAYCYYYDGSLWDHTGNPLLRKEYWAGTSAYPTTLRYDHLYRMTEETKRDPSSNVLYSLAYGYDAVGNRTSMTRDGTSYSYSYDDNDKLSALSGNQQSASLSYDGAGNLTSVSGSLFGCWTLVYDDESRLTSVTYPEGEGSQTDSYWYNALGQRMRHHFSGGYRRYLYAGERVLEVTNDAGDDVRARYTLEGESYYQPLVHLWFAGDGDRFPAYDGSGTARRLLNDEGGAAVTWYLDAFGRYLSGSGSGSTKYRYGGAWGYMTDPSGLLQLGARFYWPELGRFLQQDPIGDGMNWYAYVDGNPVVRVDPEGLDWLDDVTNFSAGFGDTLSFGLTGLARQWMGTDDFVDPCSGMYKGGGLAGLAHGLATGMVGGIRAAGRKAAGREFSHFIPKRSGGPRSIWNGNYVTPLRHARHDPYRYLRGMRKTDKLLPGLQQADRVPNTWRGVGLGLGWGLGGRRSNHGRHH